MWKRLPVRLRGHGLTLVIVVLFVIATILIFFTGDRDTWGWPLFYVVLVLNLINAWLQERRRRIQRRASDS